MPTFEELIKSRLAEADGPQQQSPGMTYTPVEFSTKHKWATEQMIREVMDRYGVIVTEINDIPREPSKNVPKELYHLVRKFRQTQGDDDDGLKWHVKALVPNEPEDLLWDIQDVIDDNFDMTYWRIQPEEAAGGEGPQLQQSFESMVEAGLVGVTFHHMHIDTIGSPGQFEHKYQIKAETPERVVGVLDYTLFEDTVHVDWIEVAEDVRRRGIARGMVVELKRQNPGVGVQWGMTTPEGAALRQASASESFESMVEAAGTIGWFNPETEQEVLAKSGVKEHDHFAMVFMNPSLFGVAIQDTKGWRDTLDKVIENGWVRVNYYGGDLLLEAPTEEAARKTALFYREDFPYDYVIVDVGKRSTTLGPESVDKWLAGANVFLGPQGESFESMVEDGTSEERVAKAVQRMKQIHGHKALGFAELNASSAAGEGRPKAAEFWKLVCSALGRKQNETFEGPGTKGFVYPGGVLDGWKTSAVGQPYHNEMVSSEEEPLVGFTKVGSTLGINILDPSVGLDSWLIGEVLDEFWESVDVIHIIDGGEWLGTIEQWQDARASGDMSHGILRARQARQGRRGPFDPVAAFHRETEQKKKSFASMVEASDTEQDRDADQMLARYQTEPTNLWLYTDMPVKDRVAWAYLAADEFKEAPGGEDMLERFVASLNQVVEDPETFWQQIEKKDPKRAEYLKDAEWTIEEVPLSDIGVYPRFGGFPDEYSRGTVLDTAEALKGDKTRPIKRQRILKMSDKWMTILHFLPPILVPGGTLRGQKKDYKQTKYDIDDGNHRTLAAALDGAGSIIAFVGKPKGAEKTEESFETYVKPMFGPEIANIPVFKNPTKREASRDLIRGHGGYFRALVAPGGDVYAWPGDSSLTHGVGAQRIGLHNALPVDVLTAGLDRPYVQVSDSAASMGWGEGREEDAEDLMGNSHFLKLWPEISYFGGGMTFRIKAGGMGKGESFESMVEAEIPSFIKIPALKDPVLELVKNPQRRDILRTDKSNFGNVRGFLVGDDLIIWNEAIHFKVRRGANLPEDAVPLDIWHEGGVIYGVVVTDATRNTPWHHSPELADRIRSHPSVPDGVEIGYYDEDIVGDWEGLETEESFESMVEGKVVCAWCGKKLRDDPRIEGISHGLCSQCAEKMSAEIKQLPTKEKGKEEEQTFESMIEAGLTEGRATDAQIKSLIKLAKKAEEAEGVSQGFYAKLYRDADGPELLRGWIEEADPHPRKAFGSWIAREWKKQLQGEAKTGTGAFAPTFITLELYTQRARIREELTKFMQAKARKLLKGKQGDINSYSYKTFHDVMGDIDPLALISREDVKESRDKIEGMADSVVLEKGPWLIIESSEPGDLQELGKGGGWCTVQGGKYAQQYTEKGPLYIVYSRKRTDPYKPSAFPGYNLAAAYTFDAPSGMESYDGFEMRDALNVPVKEDWFSRNDPGGIVRRALGNDERVDYWLDWLEGQTEEPEPELVEPELGAEEVGQAQEMHFENFETAWDDALEAAWEEWDIPEETASEVGDLLDEIMRKRDLEFFNFVAEKTGHDWDYEQEFEDPPEGYAYRWAASIDWEAVLGEVTPDLVYEFAAPERWVQIQGQRLAQKAGQTGQQLLVRQPPPEGFRFDVGETVQVSGTDSVGVVRSKEAGFTSYTGQESPAQYTVAFPTGPAENPWATWEDRQLPEGHLEVAQEVLHTFESMVESALLEAPQPEQIDSMAKLLKKYYQELGTRTRWRDASHEELVRYVTEIGKNADPQPNWEHGRWLLKQWKKFIKSKMALGLDLEDEGMRQRVHNALVRFVRAKSANALTGDAADIGKYKTFGDLQDTLAALPEEAFISKRALKRGKVEDRFNFPGSETVAESDRVKVVKVTTPESASIHAEGTDWCTADTRAAEGYLEGGPLYVVYEDLEGDGKWVPLLQTTYDGVEANFVNNDPVDEGWAEFVMNRQGSRWTPAAEIRQVLEQASSDPDAARGGFGGLLDMMGQQDALAAEFAGDINADNEIELDQLDGTGRDVLSYGNAMAFLKDFQYVAEDANKNVHGYYGRSGPKVVIPVKDLFGWTHIDKILQAIREIKAGTWEPGWEASDEMANEMENNALESYAGEMRGLVPRKIDEWLEEGEITEEQYDALMAGWEHDEPIWEIAQYLMETGYEVGEKWTFDLQDGAYWSESPEQMVDRLTPQNLGRHLGIWKEFTGLTPETPGQQTMLPPQESFESMIERRRHRPRRDEPIARQMWAGELEGKILRAMQGSLQSSRPDVLWGAVKHDPAFAGLTYGQFLGGWQRLASKGKLQKLPGGVRTKPSITRESFESMIEYEPGRFVLPETQQSESLTTGAQMAADICLSAGVPFAQVVETLASLESVTATLGESPKIDTLKKNQKKLTDEEREKVMGAKAVWHFGPDGAASPAVKKAVVNGKTWYWSSTHRAYQVRPTLDGAIKIFHDFVVTTA